MFLRESSPGISLVLYNNKCYSFLLVEITGNPNVGFKEEDIEGDFDPKKYDEAMQVWNAFWLIYLLFNFLC